MSKVVSISSGGTYNQGGIMKTVMSIIFIGVLFTGTIFGQLTIQKLMDIKWGLSISQIKSIFSTKELTEKKTMQFNGFVFQDTMDTIPVEVAMLFSNENKLVGKAIGYVENKNDMEKVFGILKQKSIENFGKEFKENSLAGMEVVNWKLSSGENVILSYMKSGPKLMLSILKL